jgi:hypothetical protein
MNFPDRVFAVGGAGKEIAFKILESDWIVDEILEPRPNPVSVTVTIIDTAEGEGNTDRERLQEVRERLSRKESELREESNGGRTGSVEVEYKLITEDIYLSGVIDLVGDEAVPRIAAGNGMDEENWWIEDRHVNENLDFAKGVVRKRGLGKAIYYKAYAEDDDISSVIDLPDKGQVAMLAGLGGGTGSGILLDLDTHLQERQRTAEITLFGILPNHTEGIKENTNAFAALSELEYNALEGNSVFKDRVLVPIDPTNFDGKTGNRIQTGKYLEELDEALVYLIASYYNTQELEDPFADTPDYAPFTIGIPQVLRYNVQAINQARERFRDVLQTKEDALEIEEEIYSRIDRFLTKHFEATESGLRDADRAQLSERLEDAESWLDFDLFRELDYQSLSIFEDIVSDAKEESDDIVEQVDIISGSLRAVNTTSGDTGAFVDTIDEHLAKVLERDLTMLGRRRNILEQRNAIDDNRIRDAVEYLLGTGETEAAPGVKLQRLESRHEDLKERRSDLREELEAVEEELEEARDEQSAEIERRTGDWVREVEDDVQRLQRIDVPAVETQMSTLVSNLEQFNREVANAANDGEVDQVREDAVLTVLDNLEAELSAVGVDFQEQRQAITASLSELKRAKKAYLAMEQEPSTLDKITPWESSTEQQQQEANKDFRVQRNKLADREVFQIGPPSGQFTSELVFEGERTVSAVRNQRTRLQESVANSLQARVENLAQDHQQSLSAELDGDEPRLDELKEVARQVFREEIAETDDIEERKASLETELEEVEDQLALYEPMIDLFEEVNNRRETWSEKSGEVTAELNRDDDTVQSIPTESEEYVYVKNVQPEDIFKATGSDDIATSDLFSSDQENRRVRSNLEELARNARNQQYTGLRRRKIAQGNSRYGEQKVRVAALSKAISQVDPDALDFEEMFRGAFDLGASGKRVESPFTSWRVDVGGDWDLSLSVFITGVFLDNIRKAVQADGYHAGYEQRRDELDDDILIHHSYGLEDGYYVRRKNLLNMEDEDDVRFYLRDGASITDDLLGEHFERVSHTDE